MPHVVEPASSGRAKCRACGGRIAAGEWRFGERLPNPYDDQGGEMTHWFHPWCAAYRRPQAVVDAAEQLAVLGADAAEMLAEARLGVVHHRLARVSSAERATTGRATCRSCREPIAKDTWRISLLYYEDGRFSPSGFVHAACAPAYFESSEFVRRLRHFTPSLTDADLADFPTGVP